jgi:hypothetical protein
MGLGERITLRFSARLVRPVDLYSPPHRQAQKASLRARLAEQHHTEFNMIAAIHGDGPLRRESKFSRPCSISWTGIHMATGAMKRRPSGSERYGEATENCNCRTQGRSS